MSFAQAIAIATLRATNTGVRQRVFACICGDSLLLGSHFMVRPVDRIPAEVFA